MFRVCFEYLTCLSLSCEELVEGIVVPNVIVQGGHGLWKTGKMMKKIP